MAYFATSNYDLQRRLDDLLDDKGVSHARAVKEHNTAHRMALLFVTKKNSRDKNFTLTSLCIIKSYAPSKSTGGENVLDAHERNIGSMWDTSDTRSSI